MAPVGRTGGDPRLQCPHLGSGSDDPYSVYDLARNAGWLNVNIDHDTTGFAIENLRRWLSPGKSKWHSIEHRLF